MKEPVIGINLPGSCGTPDALERGLNRIVGDGYDLVEVGLSTFPLIIGGRVNDAYVEWLGGVLEHLSD